MSTGTRVRVRVIGVGNPLAGDDAFGIEVVRRLRGGGLDPGVEVVEARDGAAVAEALQGVEKAIVVDVAIVRTSPTAGRDRPADGQDREGHHRTAGRQGAVGFKPGWVLRLRPEELSRARLMPLSTHGLGVAEAIELARAINPQAVARRIVIVAAVVDPARCVGPGLSPPVSAAVERAVRWVREEIRRAHG